ncbi:unnamed protein product [Symbiodinium sp. CCMP2592]|nr:unnamed protein product [Symbiodinium sp. CCMP2592]
MHASAIDKAALQSHVKAEASSLGFQLGWSVLLVIAAPCDHPHYKQNPSECFNLCDSPTLLTRSNMHASAIDKAALQSHVKAEASSLGFQLGWSVLLVIAAPCDHPHYKQNPSECFNLCDSPTLLTRGNMHASAIDKAALQSHVKDEASSLGFQLGWSVLLVIAAPCDHPHYKQNPSECFNLCDSPTLLTRGNMHASAIDKAALQSHVKAEASSLGFQLGWSVLLVIAAPCDHPHYKQNPSECFNLCDSPTLLTRGNMHASAIDKAALQSHVKAEASSLGFQLGWSVLLVIAAPCDHPHYKQNPSECFNLCDSPTLLTRGNMHASAIDKAALQSHVKAEASSLGFQLGWSVLLVIAAPCDHPHYKQNPSECFNLCDSPTLLTRGNMHASAIDKAALQSHVKAEASSLGFQLGWSVLLVIAAPCDHPHYKQNPSECFNLCDSPTLLTRGNMHASAIDKAALQSHVKDEASSLGFQLGWSVLLVIAASM